MTPHDPETPMTDQITTELAARMPWLVADQETWWDVTGTYGADQGTFTNCLARVLPDAIAGFGQATNLGPLFEVMVYGAPEVVPASSITSARELLLVLADQPGTAYYPDDQASLEAALEAHRA